MILDISIFLATILIGLVLWLPRLRTAPIWRAMITPLASIIGSGFLVLGPVLGHSYGKYAPAVMLALCVLAWGFGTAIRANIAAIEASGETGELRKVDAFSSALLGFAYTISVAYYLNLFGAFSVSLTPLDSPFSARVVTTAIYIAILITGWTKGFRMLESMEYSSVSLKLAIIGGLLVGLTAFAWGKISTGAVHFNPPNDTGWAAVTLAFGLIVTVQGFETSRYLGDTYDARIRIMSMRLAQMIATLIYMVYILLLTFVFEPGQIKLDETAIIDMMKVVSPVLPVLLVAAALAAQFSAAVADTSGSGGLIAELTGGRLGTRRAYALVGVIGITLTWNANVFEIISYASRAFAAYYAVQAGLAAWRVGKEAGNWPQALVFAGLAGLGVAIVIFGQPVG